MVDARTCSREDQAANCYRRYMDLCVNGLSKAIGPLTRPPRATGVCPVQNTHTYTAGMLLLCSPTHDMCNHLVQLSHCTMGRPSSLPLHTQRVLSLERLLRSVEGVVRSSVVGDPLKEFEKGS